MSLCGLSASNFLPNWGRPTPTVPATRIEAIAINLYVRDLLLLLCWCWAWISQVQCPHATVGTSRRTTKIDDKQIFKLVAFLVMVMRQQMKGGVGENLLGRWGRMLFHILNVYFIHSYIERWKREGERMNDRESVALCWWLYLILLSGGTMTEENLLIGGGGKKFSIEWSVLK